MERAKGRLLSRREAADRLGVHYNTIRNLEASGDLESQKVEVQGREEVRVAASDVDRLLQERRGRVGAGLANVSDLLGASEVASRRLIRQAVEMREQNARLTTENLLLRDEVDQLRKTIEGLVEALKGLARPTEDHHREASHDHREED